MLEAWQAGAGDYGITFTRDDNDELCVTRYTEYNLSMIPLSIFLIAWLVALAIFVIVALISIMQMLRYALAHPITYLTTFVFVAISAGIILGTLLFLSKTDLQSSLDLKSVMQGSINFN